MFELLSPSHTFITHSIFQQLFCYNLTTAVNNTKGIMSIFKTSSKLAVFGILFTTVCANSFAQSKSKFPSGLKSSLLFHYTFDKDTDTKIIDSSKKGNNAVLSYDWTSKESSAWQKTGAKNGSLKFDGHTQLTLPVPSKLKDTFTVCFWYKTDKSHEVDEQANGGDSGLTGQHWLLKTGMGGMRKAGMGVSVGTNGISVYEHACDYVPARVVYEKQLGKDWVHVAVVYSRKKISLFVDGEKVGKADKSPMEFVYPAIMAGRMGAGFSGKSFVGGLDEFMMFKSAVSADNVKKLYKFSQGKGMKK